MTFMSSEEYEAERLRHEMIQADYHNRLNSLIEGLSAEETLTLVQLLSAFIGDESSVLLPHERGVLIARLQYVYNVCTVCGRSHEDTAAHLPPYENLPRNIPEGMEGLSMNIITDEPVTVDVPEEPEEPTVELPTQSQPDEFSWLRQDGFMSMEHYRSELAEYGCIRMPGQLRRDKRVTCNRCKLVYESLNDRMLRAADDCMGCQQKSKWG